MNVELSANGYLVCGSLDGTVISISPDAIGDPDMASLPEGTWYRAMVRADAGGLQENKGRNGGKPLSVLPGMTGSVEIRTGRRSVLAFVLQPMMESQEAFTGR